ncbi:MAG: hypothetical protein IT561_08855, partial [Alphaproteobacteria bacterium]|nr:hypothetical protein [Alphaproteobacteria bacterium]
MTMLHARLAGVTAGAALFAIVSPALGQAPPAPATVAQVRQLNGELVRLRDQVKAVAEELKAQIERAVAAAAARQEADAAARERIERAEARAERLEADVGAV